MDETPTPAPGLPMRQLAPAARVRWRVSRVLGGILPGAGTGAFLGVLVLADGPPAIILVVPAVMVVIGAAVGWWSAGARYRRFGYRLDDDVLQVRDGVIVHTDAAVPMFRVQHVDLGRGPLQLLFGLTTLVVHTAAPAADVVLPDVLAADAEALRDTILTSARRAAAALGTVDVDAV
jgi:hypothetical protein